MYHKGCLRQWKYSVWYHNEDSCYFRLFKCMECIAQKMNFHVNCGLWVFVMCQCGFINSNKCTSLEGNADNARGYAYMGTGGIWEMSVLSSYFCCESNATFCFLKKVLIKTSMLWKENLGHSFIYSACRH